MSTVLVQSGATWLVAERPFCPDAQVFVPARRPTERQFGAKPKQFAFEEGPACASSSARDVKSLDCSEDQVITSQQKKEGVWFNYESNGSVRLWYPYNVEWFCTPGSAAKRLKFSSNVAGRLGAGMGLRNRRNACFLNSAVQALTYLPPLLGSAVKDRHGQHCARKSKALYCGLCEFEAHLRTITQPRRGVVAKAFKVDAMDLKFYKRLHSEALTNYNVSTNRQACAYEALTVLLEWLRKYDIPQTLESKFLKHQLPMAQLNTSYLGQVFGQIIQHRRTCLNCGEETIVHEVVNDHVLSPNGAKTLEAALTKHFAPEELDEANKSDCDKCKSKQKKRLERRILVPPNVLVVVVRRSLWAGKARAAGGGLMKDNRTLHAPRVLDLAPYLRFAGCFKAGGAGSYGQLEDHRYEITSAVVHHGVPMVGHYVALCRAPNGQFYNFDDELVSPVGGEDRLLKELSKAYIYFYTRVSGGTPLPSQVNHTTDQALHTLLPEQNGTRPLSLLVSVSSQTTAATDPKEADSESESKQGRNAQEGTTGDILQKETTITGGGEADTSSITSTASTTDKEDTASERTASTVTSFARATSLFKSKRARASKKVRALHENVLQFFRSPSNLHSGKSATTTDESNKWDSDTLKESGANLDQHSKLVTQASEQLQIPKKIPGNKRYQHDLEYDKGRLKKKKTTSGTPRGDHNSSRNPEARCFDQMQRDIQQRR
eukprot:Protomagalhaensia_sp_Gyna_25__1030@NODE_149_length_4881_cov_201_115448_g115_i0_p1_GENE_NODE_149_length_4881_cov_201_115448_g115_i0NODE_149_length_4881_cov_201_115448_g115_i0_p1_ORF_typecomplete_len717_score123_82UCH/PF00443_29/2e40UCH_1/PF13423_6/5e16UCH_1/PF13423_6/2_7e03DUF2236/PF09995_9/0_039OSD/PF03392_13/0_12CNDH2_N/PF06278_11/6_7e03CNDH2_N/PF06278_11/0_46_NODE_149_length_4881_cov_201_115448_g115_i010193169